MKLWVEFRNIIRKFQAIWRYKQNVDWVSKKWNIFNKVEHAVSTFNYSVSDDTLPGNEKIDEPNIPEETTKQNSTVETYRHDDKNLNN